MSPVIENKKKFFKKDPSSRKEKKCKKQDRVCTATSHFVLHSCRDTCSVRSLSSPMSSMAKRTSSFRGSTCLSSFSCWHSAINCNTMKGQLSNLQLAMLRWHIIYTEQAVPCSLAYFWPQPRPKQQSPGTDKTPIFLSSLGYLGWL